MANEQTSVPLYAASEILTAANMNISAGTGVPVFATTVTRDAAFGGAGEKVLAEGQLCYLSASNIVQYYDGAAWATVGPLTAGLTLVSTTAWSGVSATIDNVFSGTYTHYKIICSATASTGSATIIKTQLRVGGVTNTSSNYSSARSGYTYAGAINADVVSAGAYWFLWRGNGSTSFGGGFAGSMDICYPAVATPTWVNGTSVDGSYQAAAAGVHNVSTAFDGIIFTNDAGGTVTGTISIFGYTK
jgi:hypothetical protein